MHFRISLPPDSTLSPIVRQIAERVAQCAGYTAQEASRIGGGVGRATELILARATAAPGAVLDVRFERDRTHLDVRLCYPSAGERRGAVDPALSSEVLRHGLDSVEFGDEGGMEYCRLRRALPRERVDHQCEMPPDGGGS